MAKKSGKGRMVYSTDPNYNYESNAEETASIPPSEQSLEVHIERKQRGGKVATLVKGFVGPEEDLKTLAKELKAACGVGGSAKAGKILIQGAKREKVMDILKGKGYQVKRVGG